MKGPNVGVGVIIVKDGKILLSKRRAAHGAGTWSLPGGKLHFSETVEECARRELFEETGLKVSKLQFAGVTDDFFQQEDLHYITIFFAVDYKSGEILQKEPDKSGPWMWFAQDKLPKPLFLPFKNLLKQQKTTDTLTV